MCRAPIISFLLTACLLSACAQAPVPEPAAVTFRRETSPIGSAALFDMDRFLGDWAVVAEYPGAQSPCPGTVTWARSGPGFTRARCPGAPEARALTGPGRLTGSGEAPIWVLWVDSGYRTAVLGTPDGSFGRILNRGRPIPDDRFRAAVEILDFNGYDVTRLVEIPE